MRRTVSLKRDDSGAIVLRVGKYVESFDPFHLTEAEIIDKVRWIYITASVSTNDSSIKELLRANRVIA